MHAKGLSRLQGNIADAFKRNYYYFKFILTSRYCPETDEHSIII